MTDILSPRQAAAARVRAEGLVKLEAAAKLFPTRRGKPVSKTTLLRWILDGKRQVKLDACRESGVWHTSLAAVLRFRTELGI